MCVRTSGPRLVVISPFFRIKQVGDEIKAGKFPREKAGLKLLMLKLNIHCTFQKEDIKTSLRIFFPFSNKILQCVHIVFIIIYY